MLIYRRRILNLRPKMRTQKNLGKVKNANVEIIKFPSGNEWLKISSPTVNATVVIHDDGTLSFDIHPRTSGTNVTVYETDETMPQFERDIVLADEDDIISTFQVVRIQGAKKTEV